MKSRQIVPMEMRGYFIDDKTDVFSNLPFQWKVDLTYIQRCYPNFLAHSKVRRNLQW